MTTLSYYPLTFQLLASPLKEDSVYWVYVVLKLYTQGNRLTETHSFCTSIWANPPAYLLDDCKTEWGNLWVSETKCSLFLLSSDPRNLPERPWWYLWRGFHNKICRGQGILFHLSTHWKRNAHLLQRLLNRVHSFSSVVIHSFIHTLSLIAR